MKTVEQNPIGLPLRFRITSGGKPVDLTPFVGETVEVFAEPQEGATRTWAAAIEGEPTEGVVVYTTVDGDLDRFGRWRLQAHLLKAGATEPDPPALELRSSKASLRVEDALDA